MGATTLAGGAPLEHPAPPATFRPRIPEAAFQDAVAELARTLGWLVVHHGGNQHRKAWYDTTGFPDLVLIHPTGMVWFRELKTDKGKLTAAQQKWYRRLVKYGANVDIWRPADWPDIVAALSNGRAAPQ